MEGKVVCTHCGSEHVVFSKKRGVYFCEDCGREIAGGPLAAPLRIFLSYGHDSNEELVRLIKADLERRGHEVWFDKAQIKAGHDWRESITTGILSSQRVLSFLSKHSTRDPGVCLDEIAIAIGVKAGNIQTILVESEQEVRPPPSVSHIQWLDMHDWKTWRAAGPDAWDTWYQGKLKEIFSVVESDQARRFAGEIRTLEERLKPISSDARIFHLLKKGLVGRAWLEESMEAWRVADRKARLFWILGAPGMGKSAFAAHMAHYGRDKVVAVHFCEYDKPDHRSAHRIVRTLAFQLATRLPDYRKFLLTLPELADLDSKNAAELFSLLLSNPLRHTINGGRDRYLVVIDALDEAGSAGGRNELVEMLARHAVQLPDWIGIVITSRPESAVLGPLQGLNPTMLDAGTDSNRTDILEYLRRELAEPLAGRRDAEEILQRLLQRSGGVFLYAESICHDLKQGLLSLDRLDDFPDGLGGVFWQFFERQFPDLDAYRRNIRPALRAILAAAEPLPLEMLDAMLHWRQEERSEFLHALGSLFLVAVENRRQVIKPHHKTLADWLTDESRSGPYFVSVLEGHKMLSYALDSFSSRDAPDYLLSHGHEHVIAISDWDRLAAMVRTDEHLQATALRLGTVVALENARAIATALAGMGNKFWNDLLRCADQYCRFGEEIRHSPSILVDLIQRGDVERVRRIIALQPDVFHRGVLMLATAPLLEKLGHDTIAAEYAEEGARVVRERTAAGVSGGDWYTPETETLLSTMQNWEPRLPRFHVVDEAAMERLLKEADAGWDSKRVVPLPLLYRLLTHVVSYRTRFYSGRALFIAFSLMIYFIAWQIISRAPLPIKKFPDWLAICFLMLVAWTFVYGFIMSGAVAALRRMKDRVEKNLLQNAVALESMSPESRGETHARLLRSYFLSPDEWLSPLSEQLMAFWAVRYFRMLRTKPQSQASLIADASMSGGPVFDSLVKAVRDLTPDERVHVFDALFERALTRAEDTRLLQMLVAHSDRLPDMTHLVACMTRYRELTDPEDRQDLRGLLCCLTPAELGKAVLASTQRHDLPPGQAFRRRMVKMVSNFPFMSRVRFAVGSPWGLALAVALVTPYMVFLYTLLVLGLVIILISQVAFMLAAGAPADPYGLAERCRGKPPGEMRSIVSRFLQGLDLSLSSWRRGSTLAAWALAPAAFRHLRDTVILQSILRQEIPSLQTSHSVFRKLISWLSRYGRPADVVLGVMDDRELLAVAKKLKPVTAKSMAVKNDTASEPADTSASRQMAEGARFRLSNVPGAQDDAAQLKRALPLRPVWMSLIISLALSGVLVALWVGAWKLTHAGSDNSWIYPFAARACLAGCAVLVVAQHAYPVLRLHQAIPWSLAQIARVWRKTFSKSPASEGRGQTGEETIVRRVAVCYGIAVGLTCIVVIHDLADAARHQAESAGRAFPVEHADTAYLHFTWIVVLIAKFLAPSILSRWRGSNLLYPSVSELWQNRLWCLGYLLAGPLLLALFARWAVT